MMETKDGGMKLRSGTRLGKSASELYFDDIAMRAITRNGKVKDPKTLMRAMKEYCGTEKMAIPMSWEDTKYENFAEFEAFMNKPTRSPTKTKSKTTIPSSFKTKTKKTKTKEKKAKKGKGKRQATTDSDVEEIEPPIVPPVCPICNQLFPGKTETDMAPHVEECLTMSMLMEENKSSSKHPQQQQVIQANPLKAALHSVQHVGKGCG
eukprot:TRINITY_DN6909_c0_g1_i1.p1 TRINITY_DN6909_c0_g1~~TRINITY_DN6909_c0_g1_i1.p1  ORF type:complete len:207 (+),score=32.39 TRINITY_DN6909_c0_g1_i1:2-622(+)